VNSKLYSLLVMTGFFVVGVSVIHSTHGRYLISRDPAAIRQIYDFTHLRGTALEVAAKERIMQGFDIAKSADEVAFTIGHFAFINASGEKTFACREYGKLILNFEADGMAVSGERPQMTVHANCEISTDLALINPMRLPIAEIFSQKPADGEFEFHEAGKVSLVRFSHLSDEWPRKWILVGVQMSGTTSSLNIDGVEVRKILGQPTVISF
jgi:hypothetical protein